MTALADALVEALSQLRAGQLSASELSSWAANEVETYLANPSHKYAFRDDVTLEALGLVAASLESAEPELELDAAEALLTGAVPFSVSRLVLLDPAWITSSLCAASARALAQLGLQLDNGDDWTRAIASVDLAAGGLAGDDYVEVLVLEAFSVLADLSLVVNGTVEVLGPGRPRVDASLLAERLQVLAQVVRGERPFRATVRGRGAGDVTLVLSY